MTANFLVDRDACVGCGACVRDCVAGIIDLADRKARVRPELQAECIGCQHCLAICPVAAVRVQGRNPADSTPLADYRPDAANLDLLVRSRRSVRQFAPDPVPADLLARVLEQTSYAPTGVNARARHYAVIADAAVLRRYREKSCRALVQAPGDAPDWLVELARDWLDGGTDVIFRGAPHLLVVSVAREAPCVEVDGVIALSYFDLIAQANGIGTVWAGMIDAMLRAVPECREWLGIPESHRVSYAVLFGMAGVQYARTVQYRPETVHVVSLPE